eukprot:CAMPEP_0181132710 /NCGR_PEP_ID=MMETSP1071-20121207/31140_1 /TAXON_ID=35127 /ORGANISM="Thalassiosira sp., Strain NH16" /LENGTH=186 /DNA_ID=CAMNT_0023219061 /DNA_START=17 /DNA_END=577 /DNA_ORIENTATION=+
MGFLKKQSYPARRNRIPQGQSHPASVIPPSSYGAHDPQPMPPSVYQSNGMATVVPASSAAAAGVGSFPSNMAPVQATVYVPGQGGTAATACVPGGAQRPVQATVYNPNGPNGNNHNNNAAVGPPSSNPLYQAQRPSFNNGKLGRERVLGVPRVHLPEYEDRGELQGVRQSDTARDAVLDDERGVQQ